MSRVEVRLWEGEARVAGQRVEVTAEGRGLRLPQAGNVRLRALTFGERAQLARMIADGENTAEALAGAVTRLAAADAEISEDLRLVIEILSLHLAGAGSGAPGFAEEVGLLGRWMGWSPAQIEIAAAVDVDEVARSYALAQKEQEAPTAPGDGWVSLRLDGPTFDTPAAGLSALDSLRSELASDILRRVRALPDLDLLRGVPTRAASARESHYSHDSSGLATAFRQAEWGVEASGNDRRASPDVSPFDPDERASARQSLPALVSAVEGTPRREGVGDVVTREFDQPAFTILDPAVAPVAAGSGATPRPPTASWTPSAEWLGSRDSLSAERLAAIYPEIFGGGPSAVPQPTAEPARTIDRPAVRGEPRNQADFDPFAGAKALAAQTIARAPVAAAASAASVAASAAAALGFDVGDVAKALHRAADLRGVAP